MESLTIDIGRVSVAMYATVHAAEDEVTVAFGTDGTGSPPPDKNAKHKHAAPVLPHAIREKIGHRNNAVSDPCSKRKCPYSCTFATLNR